MFYSSENSVLRFRHIPNVVFRYLTRFKHASVAHSSLEPLVNHLTAWIEEWEDDISSSTPSFDDPLKDFDKRSFVIRHLKDRAQKVSNIIERERAALDRSSARRRAKDEKEAAARAGDGAAAFEFGYEGPGEEREEGPRHDNDFVDIAQIQIAPTNGELVCRIPPYLPYNVPNAPHTYAAESIQRLLDIQFRLLREELT